MFSLLFANQLHSELNLRQQIFNMNSSIPLIILLSSRSNYVVRMIYSFAEQMPKNRTVDNKALDVAGFNKRKIQVLDASALKDLDYEKCLKVYLRKFQIKRLIFYIF